MKSKIIAFRTTEDLFEKYSSLNIKSRKMFVNKCNELLEKFLSLNVNKSSQVNVNKSTVKNVNKSTVKNVNKSSQVNVNKLYSDSFNPKQVQTQLRMAKDEDIITLEELFSEGSKND